MSVLPNVFVAFHLAPAECSSPIGNAPTAVGLFQVHVVERAGHWIHVDNPDALSGILVSTLEKRFRPDHDSSGLR